MNVLSRIDRSGHIQVVAGGPSPAVTVDADGQLHAETGIITYAGEDLDGVTVENGLWPQRVNTTVWEGRRCVFVGDLKYKKADHGIPNADLYQLLAYTIGADLPGGLLIYAQGEEDPTVHAINHAGKQLEIMAVDLSGSPERILAKVGKVAERIRSTRFRSLGHHAA